MVKDIMNDCKLKKTHMSALAEMGGSLTTLAAKGTATTINAKNRI